MITLEKQSDPEPPFENCCFCRVPTMFWTCLPERTPGQQVACCEQCGKDHESYEVPSKKVWWDKERRLNPRLF